jgi:quercetin dioxygenase-like cupin family protein
MPSIHYKKAPVYRLPGRDWYYMVGPGSLGCKGMTFGVVEFPPGPPTERHHHDRQEEIIYTLEGSGWLDFGDHREPLKPGYAVYIPRRTTHCVVPAKKGTLRIISVFSPPVIPGSYDPSAKRAARRTTRGSR